MEDSSECAGTPGPKGASASPWCPEDSGYCTITPSSADSGHQNTAHNSIENIDHNATAPYFYLHPHIHKRRPLSTPDSSTTASSQFTTGVAGSLIPGIYGDKLSHSYNRDSCSTTTEPNGNMKCSKRNVTFTGFERARHSLKRQRVIEETESNSEELLTSSAYDKSDERVTDLSVSERLRNLTFNDEPKRTNAAKRARKIGNFTRTASLCSTPTLQGVHDNLVDLDTSDYFSRSHITLDDSLKEASLLYPTTPVKSSRRTIINPGPELMLCNRLQRTPDKSKVDPQFAEEYLQLEGRFAKRLNFTAPIGSPEKNKILYPKLKLVTSPKARRDVKTPDKCKKSPKVDVKCKQLLMRRSLCGLEKVDFLKMLGEQQDQRPAVQNILTYLNGEDVCRMCLVSQTWRKICQHDPKANRRRKTHIDFRRTTKENYDSKVAPRGKLLHSKSYDCHRSLKDIRNDINIMQVSEMSNTSQISPPVSPKRQRFKMFLKAASHDQGQLTTCTRCRRPASVRDHLAQCQHAACAFTFCKLCLNAPHSGPCAHQLEAPSPSKPVPSCATVATAKSRRNLRRLY